MYNFFKQFHSGWAYLTLLMGILFFLMLGYYAINKMNLSSKEIAQLMSITIRAVEVSRYRLRKKLKNASDVNLFDFLMQSASA